MTLLARNEADVVDAQIAFHLHAGVDFVIATDNRSDDGTTDILERYERSGRLVLLREDGDDMRQQEWVTRMARIAATDFAADWVINSDADEFWWPRGGTLKDVFSLVPERFGIVRGCWRHFLPRPHGEESFAERMTVRLCTPASPGEKSTIHHVHQKVAHRRDPDVEVAPGNHDAIGENLKPLRGWHPIEILHFSLRSVEQLRARDVAAGAGRCTTSVSSTSGDSTPRSTGVSWHRSSTSARSSDAELECGILDGSLAIDTRLRNALRVLRDERGDYVLPDPNSLLTFPAPGLDDAAAFASEASLLAEIDAIPRAENRVAMLEARLATVRTLRRR